MNIVLKEKNQIEKINDSCLTYKKAYNSKYAKFSKLGDWVEKESTYFYEESRNTKQTYLKYSYGQLIKVDFGINIGTELSHTHFAIVLNNDDTIKTDNITVLPLTSKNGYKRISLGNLIKETHTSLKYQNHTYGIITQIKTISKKRILLNNNKHFCSKEVMNKINKALKEYLNIKEI